MTSQLLPRYDSRQTYQWNYEHAPEATPELEIPECPGDWTFCGRPVKSPLGIPAGPLLNGKWCLYYAELGFDVLTYKTVRSSQRECYPMPNLWPVATDQMSGTEEVVETGPDGSDSWAVSFGMPSMTPDVWRRDVEQTRKRLSPHKLLCVSVVGTVNEKTSLEELARDYARCGKWAVEAGADVVEANFSCPNVSTCDGQLYQQPESAAVVARSLREVVGEIPLVIKIGHLRDESAAAGLLDALSLCVDGLAMTNSIAARVRHGSSLMFEEQSRGICGAAIREASLRQVAMVRRLIAAGNHTISIIGVGGISSAEEVRRYLDAGAECTHIATAAMLDPRIGIAIRGSLSRT